MDYLKDIGYCLLNMLALCITVSGILFLMILTVLKIVLGWNKGANDAIANFYDDTSKLIKEMI